MGQLWMVFEGLAHADGCEFVYYLHKHQRVIRHVIRYDIRCDIRCDIRHDIL